MSNKAAFVYHDSLSRHVLREGHPLVATRLQHTYVLLDAYGAFGDGSQVVEPRLVTEAELESFHTREYIDAVKSFSRGESRFNPSQFNFDSAGDNPTFPGMFEAAALSTGASVVAAEVVSSGQVNVAFNASGGLHHAAPGHASGFCVFNDPVIAINHLLKQGLRVAYVDIDAHHGDGVQNAFYDTDRVLTISTHESGQFLFPGTGFVEETGFGKGVGYAVNVPLSPYTDDDTYLWVFRQVVIPLIVAFKPDILVSQLGIDTHYKDPLTHLMLSSRAFSQAVQELASLGTPWVALGGGGYDVSAVARCWTIAYGVMAGREWPPQIPSNYAERYGLYQLWDGEVAPSGSDIQKQIKGYAQATVQSVQRLTFPIHSLG